MSTSKVIFNVPTKAKKSAVARAAREGVTLTAVVVKAIEAYGQGNLNVEMVDNRPLRPAVVRRIKKALADYKAGRNIAGPFTPKEASAYLRSLA